MLLSIIKVSYQSISAYPTYCCSYNSR